MARKKAATVREYISAAPKEARKMLRELRAILKKAAPEAKQSLKWGSPVFEEKRILFGYAAFRTHINFMPTPSVLKQFKDELKGFKTGKGTVRFPYDRPLPKAIVTKLAKLRVKDLREKDAKWM
jgi:uncharacterized protein YdhG (YjbR/CyaY superfamily)